MTSASNRREKCMRYEQVRTILQQLAPAYHRRVSGYYQLLAEGSVSPRVRMMLDYLIDHGRYRHHCCYIHHGNNRVGNRLSSFYSRPQAALRSSITSPTTSAFVVSASSPVCPRNSTTLMGPVASSSRNPPLR